jgi:hypothetical protein
MRFINWLDSLRTRARKTRRIERSSRSLQKQVFQTHDLARVSEKLEDRTLLANASIAFTNAANAAAEGASPAVTVTLTTDANLTDAFTTTVTVSLGTAEAGDLTLVTTAVTFPANAANGATMPVTVNFIDDAVVEDNETATLNLSSPVSAGGTDTVAVGAQATNLLTINNDDTSILTITSPTTAEQDGNVNTTFVVTSSNAVEGGFAVAYSSAGVTAEATDFGNVTTGPIVFSGTAGETENIVIEILGDNIVEDNETFNVTLGVVTATTTAQIAGITTGAAGVGTINNDDTATVTVAVSPQVTEADIDADVNFSVKLDAEVEGGFTLAFAVTPVGAGVTLAEVTDFTVITTTPLTFTGALGEVQTVTIRIVGDDIVEDNETFLIDLTTVTAPSAEQTADISTVDRTVAIQNDDIAMLTLSAPTITETDANVVANFVATIDAAVEGGFSVAFASDGIGGALISTEGTDITDGATPVAFTGNAGETVNVPITIIGDQIVEENETFKVTLGAVTGASISAEQISRITTGASASAIINNDDTATVTIADVSITETDADQTLNFTATLDAPVEGGLTIAFDGTPLGASLVAAETSDFTPVTITSVTFDGAAAETETIAYTIFGDDIVEDNETFLVTLGEVTGTSPEQIGDITTGDTATGTINNDDTATLSISAPTITESGADQNVDFTVTLSAAVEGGFTVAYASALGDAEVTDINDVTTSPIAFGGLIGETEVITIEIVGDEIVETDETFTVTLGDVAATSTEQDDDITTGAVDTGTILNDDVASLTIADVTVVEGADGAVTTTATFTVTSSNPTEADVTVTVTSADGTATTGTADYTAVAGTATILGNSTATTGTIDVTIANDGRVEGTEGYFLNLTAAQFAGGADPTRAVIADNQAAGTITDDDTAVVAFTNATGAIDENFDNTGNIAVVLTVTPDANDDGNVGLDRTITINANEGASTGTDGTDFIYTDQVLTYSPNAGQVTTITNNVDIDILEDLVVDPNETAVIALSVNTDGTTTQAVIGANGTHTRTINDDDVAGAAVFDVEPNGAAGIYTIRLNPNGTDMVAGTNLQILDPAGKIVAEVVKPAGAGDTVTFNGDNGGNDTLVVDFVNGSPVPGGGLTFDGLNGNDTLSLQNGTATNVTHTLIDGDTGNVSVDGGVVNYTNLAPVIDNLSVTNRVFTFTGAGETVILDASGSLDNRIDSDQSELVDFTNPSGSLTINLTNGSDTLNIRGLDAAFNANLTANGDADDTISFNMNTTSVGTGNVTVNTGTVVVAANVTTTSGGDFDIDGTTITVNGGATVSTTGDGAIVADSTQSTSISAASTLQTVSGNIALTANAGGVAANFDGISISNSTLATTSGSILLTGSGGNDTNNNGVVVATGAITSGAGAAAVTIVGTAANGGADSDGVILGGPITTIDAAVSVTGNTVGDNGVEATDAITTTGAAATVTINGTTTGTNNDDDGVNLIGAAITTSGATAAVLVTGNSTGDEGVELAGATISTVSTNTISGTATGANAGDGVALTGAATQVSSSGGAISITGAASGGSGAGVEIVAGVTLAISATNAASISVVGTGDTGSGVIVDSPISSATGDVTLQALNGTLDDVTFGTDGDITSTSGVVTVNAASGGVGFVFMADGTLIDAGSGTIDIDSDRDVTVGGLLTTSSSDTAISITAGVTGVVGQVLDGGAGLVDLSAANGRAVIVADTGIGSGDALETTLGSLDATNNVSGTIQIAESDSIELVQVLQNEDDAITVTAGGSISVTTNGVIIDDDANANGAAAITLTTTNGSISTSAFVRNDSDNAAANINIDANGTNSDVNLSAPVIAALGNIVVTADDSVTMTAAGSILAAGAGTVSITANTNNSDGDSDDDIEMTDGSTVDAGDGAITIAANGSEAGNIQLGRLSTTTTVSISADAGAITDGGDTGGADITADSATLATATGIGTTGAIDTNIVTLTSATTTGAGNIDIDETDGITLTSIIAANGSIQVDAGGTMNVTAVTSTIDSDANDIRLGTSAGDIAITVITAGATNGDVIVSATTGAITDANAATLNVTADGFRAVAGATGVATEADPLETSVNTIEGSAVGGFFVTNDKSAAVDNVALGLGDTDGTTGISSTGTVEITVTNALTLEDPIVANGQLVALTGTNGAILSNSTDPADNDDIDINVGSSGTIALRSGANIGVIGNPVEIDAGTLAFTATGDVFVNDRVSGLVINDVDTIGASSGGGAIVLTSSNIGATTDNTLQFSHSVAATGTLMAIAIDTAKQTGDSVIVDDGDTISGTTVTLSGGDAVTLADNSTVTATGAPLNITVDSGLAGSADANSGGTVTTNGTLNSTAITITGGVDDDTFLLFPDQDGDAGGDADMINATVALDGAEGDDFYRIHVSGLTAAVDISDTGVEGAGTSDADNAIVYHTRGASTITVNSTSVSGIQTVNFTTSLDRVEADGGEFNNGLLDPNDLSDVFEVTPATLTRIAINGNNGQIGGANFDTLNLTSAAFALNGNTISVPGFSDIAFRNIETLPLNQVEAVGADTQRFDMNLGITAEVPSQSPTETGYTAIFTDTFYGVAGATSGWVVPDTANPPIPSLFAGFDVEVGTAGELFHDLVRDGHVLPTLNNTFQTDIANGTYLVSVKARDANGFVATNVDTGLALNTAVTLPGRGEFNFPMVVSDGTLTISFANTTPIEILGLDIRPGVIQGIGAAESATATPADGTTIDTFAGVGVVAGDVITVSGNLDSDGDGVFETPLTITSADARPDLAGVQVLAPDTTFSFTVQRPTGTGTANIQTSVFNGLGTGSTAAVYSAVDVRLFDFEDDSTGTTQAGYVSVSGADVFTTGLGYGFSSVVSDSTIDTAQTTAQEDLTREFVSAQSTRFSTEIANGDYAVSMVLSRPDDQLQQLSVVAEGATVIGSRSTTEVGYDVQTFNVTVSDGVLDLDISSLGGQFSLAGMEIRTQASLAVAVTVAAALGDQVADPDLAALTITGLAPAESTVTVTTTLGTVQTGQDTEPNIAGVQVVATGGTWSALVDRSAVPGIPSFTVTTVDGTGSVTDGSATILRYTSNADAGLFFDMQSAVSATTQADFIATGATTFDSLINAGFTETIGGTKQDDALIGTDYSALLQDSVTSVPPRTFRIDFDSAQTLDVTYNYGGDTFNATVATGTGTGLANLTSPPGQASHAAHTVNTVDVGNGVHRLEITFSASTATGAWQLFGASFRPTATLVAVTPMIAVPGGAPVADGTTVSTYAVTNLTMNRTYTISTTAGVINLADDDPHIDGIQFRATGVTTVNVDVVAPAVGQTITFSVEDVVGAGRASANQLYGTLANRRIDFNGFTNATASGFIGVQQDLINAGESLGWVGVAPAIQDRGLPVSTVTEDLYRDSALAEATFRIAVDAVDYDIRFYSGDKFVSSQVTFSIEGGAFTQTSALTTLNVFTNTTLMNVSDQDADGFIDIQFTGVGAQEGFVNGFDIATTGALPAAAPLLADTVGTGGAILDATTLDAVVDQAISELAATGLSPAQVDALRQVSFGIEDLGGRTLGLAGTTQVLIDDDAAGHGWNSGYETEQYDTETIDLLTVVLHELGHTLGYGDLDAELAPGDLMAGTLSVGEQRDADSLFMGDELFNYMN